MRHDKFRYFLKYVQTGGLKFREKWNFVNFKSPIPCIRLKGGRQKGHFLFQCYMMKRRTWIELGLWIWTVGGVRRPNAPIAVADTNRVNPTNSSPTGISPIYQTQGPIKIHVKWNFQLNFKRLQNHLIWFKILKNIN